MRPRSLRGQVSGRGHNHRQSASGYVGGRVGRGGRDMPSPSDVPREVVLPGIQVPAHATRFPLGLAPFTTIHPVKALEDALDEVTTFEPESLLRLSLPIFGYTEERQSSVVDTENVERFKEPFKVRPVVVAAVLTDLKREYPKNFRVRDALMTFHWLKCYGTERTISGPWKIGCLKYIRDTCKLYAKNIGSLKKYKIKFGPFEEGDVFPIAVDGMHCSTGEYSSYV